MLSCPRFNTSLLRFLVAKTSEETAKNLLCYIERANPNVYYFLDKIKEIFGNGNNLIGGILMYLLLEDYANSQETILPKVEKRTLVEVISQEFNSSHAVLEAFRTLQTKSPVIFENVMLIIEYFSAYSSCTAIYIYRFIERQKEKNRFYALCS